LLLDIAPHLPEYENRTRFCAENGDQATTARHCVFITLTPQQPESALPRITALFSTVAIEQPVNALYFEPFPFSRLILNAFPHGYRAVSLQQPAGGDVSPYCRCFSSVLLNTTGDFTFLDFLMPKHGPKEPSLMALAALLVGVAQLIVAIIALVITIRRK
jgi:hypothetical protein